MVDEKYMKGKNVKVALDIKFRFKFLHKPFICVVIVQVSDDLLRLRHIPHTGQHLPQLVMLHHQVAYDGALLADQ